MRKILLGLAVILGSFTWAEVAHAHDPIILTSDQRTPAEGPLLPDGTVSFALYGTLDAPGDTRGFRVEFAEGDPLYVSVLIPDLEPENLLDDGSLPYLVITDPAGTSSELRVAERVAFPEPFSGTNYVRLAETRSSATAGTYEVLVTGDVPARFTVSVGSKEMFGTEVENVPNRELGVAGVMGWYETPPSSLAPTTTTSEVPVTGAPYTTTSEPLAMAIESPLVGSATETDVPSEESGESGNKQTVIIALAALAVAGVSFALVRRRRKSA